MDDNVNRVNKTCHSGFVWPSNGSASTQINLKNGHSFTTNSPPFDNMGFVIPIFSWSVKVHIRINTGLAAARHFLRGKPSKSLREDGDSGTKYERQHSACSPEKEKPLSLMLFM